MHGEDDPAVQACLELLAEMATARSLPRHAGDKYRAICQILDRLQGKPKERREHTGELTHTVKIIECDDGAA